MAAGVLPEPRVNGLRKDASRCPRNGSFANGPARGKSGHVRYAAESRQVTASQRNDAMGQIQTSLLRSRRIDKPIDFAPSISKSLRVCRKNPPGWKSRRNYCQSRQPYLSAACPASDTTLSCEPVAPLTPMAPITLPSAIRGLPPRDAITSSSVARKAK